MISDKILSLWKPGLQAPLGDKKRGFDAIYLTAFKIYSKKQNMKAV
jgi:hypothetical protein